MNYSRVSGMPHATDAEEKQPFLVNLQDEEDERSHNLQNPSHLNSKSQQHHINIGSHGNGNGEVNGGLVSSNTNGGGSGGSPSSIEQMRTARSLYVMKLLSALFYAVASFLITVVNKVVLTSYK